jgi:hypothetical protein
LTQTEILLIDALFPMISALCFLFSVILVLCFNALYAVLNTEPYLQFAFR